jgi:glutathione synthase/RimK-type ligase-like ATP-grasp enzyme
VLKPSVGAGSLDAAAFSLHDDHEQRLAREHAVRLLSVGRTVMIQPYIEGIEDKGETAVIFLGGEFSHAITKGAMLAGQRGLVDGLYFEETISVSEPTEEEVDVARRALAVVPGGPDRLAYSRVDLVPAANGDPLVIELELTEPSLYLGFANGAAERFAHVIARGIRTN